MTTPPNGTFNVGALEERVSGLERSLAHIVSSLDGLAKDVRERQRFPWPAVWGGVSVLLVVIGMFGALVMYGIAANFDRDRSNIDRIETAILALTSATVPRGEHERQWLNEAQQRDDLQRQIDQLNDTFGASFSLNDTLKALMDRVDRLEQIRLDQSK